MQGELMNYSGGSEVVTQLQWYERIKEIRCVGRNFVQRLRATATCAFFGSDHAGQCDAIEIGRCLPSASYKKNTSNDRFRRSLPFLPFPLNLGRIPSGFQPNIDRCLRRFVTVDGVDGRFPKKLKVPHTLGFGGCFSPSLSSVLSCFLPVFSSLLSPFSIHRLLTIHRPKPSSESSLQFVPP